MLSILEFLINFAGGGLMNAIPLIINYFRDKFEDKQELERMKVQLELKRLDAKNEIDISNAVSENLLNLKEAETYQKALTQQFKATGFKALDFFNMGARPYVIYAFVTSYFISKYAHFFSTGDFSQLTTQFDIIALTSILGFLFVKRHLEKGTV